MAQKNKIPGFLAGLLIFLLIILVFAINWKKIEKNIRETGFIETVFGKKPETEEIPVKNEKPPVLTVETPDSRQEGESLVKTEPLVQPKQIDKNASDFLTVGNPETVLTTQTQSSQTAPNTEVQNQETTEQQNASPGNPQIATKPPVKTQDASLFFVVIDSGGAVVRKEIKRSLPVSDAPLSTAVRSLLSGPQRSEAEKGYMSLIPIGTELLSATVQNGTATLNFSENFEFNSFGAEGYYGQLMQVVFTATSYPTVNNVQFLIEGERREYLGSEGVWIGAPLSRANYR